MIIRTLLLLIGILQWGHGFSQAKFTFDQYHLMGRNRPYSYMPVLHAENNRQWCAEARYNYEDKQTASLFAGKTFTGDHKVSWSLAPMLGVSVGRFKGLSTALNIDLEYNDFYLSAQTQYSRSVTRNNDYFLYSWSEIGYQTCSWLYTGISVQQTQDLASGKLMEPGMLVGLTCKGFSIPVYLFNPFVRDKYFIVGLSYSWGGKKKQ